MPRVFRQQYTRPIPANAQHVKTKIKRRGKEVEVDAVRFKGDNGKWVVAPIVETGKQAGTHCRVPSPTWYGWIDGNAVPLCTDKVEAEKMLVKKLDKAQKEKANPELIDPFEKHRRRPLTEHLDDFKGALIAKGNTAQHVELTVSRVQAMLGGTEFVFIADLDLAKANDWLTALRRDRPPIKLPEGKTEFAPLETAQLLGVTTQSIREAVKRHGLTVTGKGNGRRLTRDAVEYLCGLASRGVSAESVNHYIRAIRSFMRWLVHKAKRLPSNPLDGLELIDTKADRRHDRRELASDELGRLLTAARSSKKTFWGLSGEDRYHLYACACGTGFRAGGLAGLTPERFHLDDEVPTVTLSVRRDKSRKGKVQPLPADVAELMRGYLAGKPAGKPIWGTGWATHGAEMLRADLADAGIPYVVEGVDGPLFADFHALRHSYLTALGRGGVDLRTAQELAGHSTPVLTARYMHVRLHDLAGSVKKLPEFLPGDEPGQGQTLAVTGTDAYSPYSPLTSAGDPDRSRVRLQNDKAAPFPEGKVAAKACQTGTLVPADTGRDPMSREAPPGFEPGYDGFAIRCHDDVNIGCKGTCGTDNASLQPPYSRSPKPIPDDLARVVAAWGDLPLPIRISILALVDAAKAARPE